MNLSIRQPLRLLFARSRYANLLKQSKRTAVIVKRRNTNLDSKFNDINAWPNLETNYTNLLYDIIETTDDSDVETPIDAVLLRHVEGLGYAGDILKVDRNLFRKTLSPTNQAIYASEKNIENTQKLREENANIPRQTLTGQETIRWMRRMNLHVPMNPKVSWTLTKENVNVAFRCAGAQVPEDCISLPDEPIVEPGQYTVIVTVNGIDSIPIKMFVYHHYFDEREGKNPILPPVWNEFKFEIGQLSENETRIHFTIELEFIN